jgi:hypothetical protein
MNKLCDLCYVTGSVSTVFERSDFLNLPPWCRVCGDSVHPSYTGCKSLAATLFVLTHQTDNRAEEPLLVAAPGDKHTFDAKTVAQTHRLL